uniref:Reverse transcriptase domain-containing protein n=1 Tax=Cannabis sativa TaxID=3483 RepID=A0A803PQY7_CANSA
MQVYKSQNLVIGADFDSLFTEGVSAEENASISRCLTVEEIRSVVFAMHPLKSPGPDGFSGIFYRKYWRIVGAKVCKIVQGFFEDQSVCPNLNHTFLCLIPKVTNASRFDQFRPISLCNFCYKIISRILTDRLKKVIDRLVSPFQSAFVPGRWIAECSMMAQEVLQSFKRKKGKHGVMAIKTDMSKAYDCLEWTFLLRVLKANGFSDHVCSIIMACVTSVTYSVLLNGAPLTPFNPKRGLRQGDPLSPFLFILCSEVLSKLILRTENNGDLNGAKVSRNATPITHLFYADDAIFFCKANGSNANALLQCISQYEDWSGQRVNKQKSGVVFSPNTSQRCKDELKNKIGMNCLRRDEKYLGNPFFFSANKRKDFNFLKEKIMSRLEALVPKALCEELDRIVARFWWVGNSVKERYRAFKSWQEIFQPKRCGGLGLRRFSDINKAMLAKLCWMVLTGMDKAWVKLMEARYCQVVNAWRVEKRAGDSRAWLGILEATNICTAGAGVLIGGGESDLWERPCVPGKSMEEVRDSFHYSRRHAFVRVSDLFMEGSRLWNEELIRESFDEEVAMSILRIRPLATSEDIIFGKGSKSGMYTVKSGYWLSQHSRFKNPNRVWEKLWRSKIHQRLKLFLWKTWSDALPSKQRLGLVDNTCSLCHVASESALHLFGSCSVLVSVKRSGIGGIRVKEMELRDVPLKVTDRVDLHVPVVENLDEMQCFHCDASILDDAAGVAAVEVAELNVGDSWVASDFHTVSGILEGELLAILLALKVARERGVRKIKILSDSKVAIMALNNGCLPYGWGTYPVFESCLCVCKCFDLVVFVHCPRSLNGVADAVAGWVRCAKSCTSGLLKVVAPLVALSLL